MELYQFERAVSNCLMCLGNERLNQRDKPINRV